MIFATHAATAHDRLGRMVDLVCRTPILLHKESCELFIMDIASMQFEDRVGIAVLSSRDRAADFAMVPLEVQNCMRAIPLASRTTEVATDRTKSRDLTGLWWNDVIYPGASTKLVPQGNTVIGFTNLMFVKLLDPIADLLGLDQPPSAASSDAFDASTIAKAFDDLSTAPANPITDRQISPLRASYVAMGIATARVNCNLISKSIPAADSNKSISFADRSLSMEDRMIIRSPATDTGFRPGPRVREVISESKVTENTQAQRFLASVERCYARAERNGHAPPFTVDIY